MPLVLIIIGILAGYRLSPAGLIAATIVVCAALHDKKIVRSFGFMDAMCMSFNMAGLVLYPMWLVAIITLLISWPGLHSLPQLLSALLR